MKIHKMGYKISNREDKEFYPQFLMTLDDRQEPGSFLLLPLELSCQKDGIYPIMNCGCGEWGCGGLYIKVRNTRENVIWETFYGLDGGEIKSPVVHAPVPIHFRREQYEAVVRDLLSLKEQYKYEQNVYRIDKEKYISEGLQGLDYMDEVSFKP